MLASLPAVVWFWLAAKVCVGQPPDDDMIPIGDDDDDVVVNCPENIPVVPQGEEFGIGVDGYENGARYCWLVETGGTHATIVFSSIHTEYRRDYVRLFDASRDLDRPDTYGWALSGEVVAPYVSRVPTSRLLIQFISDGGFGTDSATLQLGFSASVFDSSDGSCANDCSGHGACSDGKCDCEPEWGPDRVTDCSIASTPLEELETHVIELDIGAWAYFRIDVKQTQTLLIELVDWGKANSDPRLFMETDSLPTLSHYRFDDWFNWYYDCSDIHYLRGSAGAGTYFIGVANDPFRATEKLMANLTLRTAPVGNFPCLLDCNGHGTCDSKTGDCACDDGWEGSVVNAPDTCQFQVKELTRDQLFESNIRIGSWDYYKITISEEEAHARTLFVSFVSKSPHSYPVLLARHGEVPRLWEGYLPTYEAFDFDVGDKVGFERVQGQRMSLVVNQTVLEGGDWYVGVYNIWGHNGENQFNSHDDCSYELWAEVYAAGMPCPSTNNGFCDGAGTCDFNTGECDCPSDRIWRDCSFQAESLIKNGESISRSLDIDDSEYFVVSMDKSSILVGYNLVVEVTVTGGEGATPIVLARFGDLPFPNDLTQYDDHDLLSTFYKDKVHQVLLDAEEIEAAGEGDWYISVMNPEASTTLLEYEVKAVWASTVECPQDHAGQFGTCSNAGTCVEGLGRCDCDQGSVMDDCSADGVFRLNSEAPLASSVNGDDTAPPIQPDDWVYWSVVVGCEDRALSVSFETTDLDAKPLLVARRGKLPLMVDGTYDYWDFYTGKNGNMPSQRFRITSCEDEDSGCGSSGSCCIAPLNPGTAFATGSPDPGIYYVGIYNDPSSSQAITNYYMRIDVEKAPGSTAAATCETCSEGFMGDGCEEPCPGLAPQDVYSNSPSGTEQFCAGRGQCVSVTDGLSCSCENGFVGEQCEYACPRAYLGDDDNDAGEVCAGRGTCEADAVTGEPVCVCDEPYGGIACLDSCSDDCGENGVCSFTEPDATTGLVEAYCVCTDPSYVGNACQFKCPGSNAVCSDQGTCDVVHSYSGDPLYAMCECFEGFTGDDCSSVIDANSTIVKSPDDGEGSSSSKKKDTGPLSTAMVAALSALAVLMLVLAVAAALVAERRKREISRYERLVREVGAASSTIITASGSQYDAPNLDAVGDTPIPKFDEMRDVNQHVSPFHSERVDL